MIKATRAEKVFDVLILALLSFLAIMCVLPMWNVLCVSFSSSADAAAGRVGLWPVNFTTGSYAYVFKRTQYFTAFRVSVLRTVLGTAISMFVTSITAYPLSMESSKWKFRGPYVWFFFATMLFGGGLIPFYMVVVALKLVDTIWAMVLPGALSVWNVILMMNFMRRLPLEIAESAEVDGANDWTILWRIYLPMSLPVIATLTLFTAVGHWNSWFDGLIFMNSPEKYPLQTYLRGITIQIDTAKMKNMTPEELILFSRISNRTFTNAQIFIAMVPILAIYPFLQKFFVKGITLGSVKE